MSDLLDKLPEYEPRADLWDRIEADLETDERLTHLVGDLPAFEPEATLWDQIESRLEASEQSPDESRVLVHPATQSRSSSRQLTWGRWLSAGAAAACLIPIGTYLFRHLTTLPSERIEYAVEQQADWTPATPSPEVSAADGRAEAFIEQQCAEVALACQRPEVRELRAQLGELTQEEQRLTAERQRFGDDPALVRAQVKLENQRADITKELITLLRS